MRQIMRFTVILLWTVLLAGRSEAKEAGKNTYDRYSRILVSGKAVEALGKIGDPKAYGILTDALKSKEFFIRAYAAQGLGNMRDKRAVPALLKMLVGDGNYLVRVSASKALVSLGELDAEKSLSDFLSDKNAAVRANAIEQLGGANEKCLSRTLRLLSDDKDVAVRIKALEQLGIMRFAAASGHMIKALEDENAQVRRAACFGIGQLRDKMATTLLIDRLGDQDIGVRAAAKEALGQFGERSFIVFFEKDIDDSDPILKASSYGALANLKDINIVPVLLKAVTTPENPTLVKIAAARALTTLKPHISQIIDVSLSLSKSNAISLENNIDLSYKINGVNLTQVFVDALSDRSSPLYNDAPFVIRELKENISLPALRRTLFDPEVDMAANAAYVLGEFRDKNAVDDLIEVCRKYGF